MIRPLVTILVSLLLPALLTAEEVRGTQSMKLLAPADVRPGLIEVAAEFITDASETGFRFTVDSAWGEFTWDLEKTKSESNDLIPSEKAPPVGGRLRSRETAFEDTAGLPDDVTLNLTGRITEMKDGGHQSTGTFTFAGSDVTATLTLVDAQSGGPDPAPTHRNLSYGPHWRQTLDFYQAESDEPTPLAIKIHGGGWGGLDKTNLWNYHPRFLEEGISFASINYRFTWEVPHLKPPVQAPLEDAARAIQTLRHMAEELNIDPERIVCYGGSAGACSSLWLAMVDDLADPDSEDPIARQSTRLWAAGGVGAQTSIDPLQMRAWIPQIKYGGHAYGFRGGNSFEEMLQNRAEILPWIQRYSPYAQASSDDPPIFLEYTGRTLEPPTDPKELDSWATHSPAFGVHLQKRLNELGVENYLRYDGKPAEAYGSLQEFLIQRLKE